MKTVDLFEKLRASARKHKHLVWVGAVVPAAIFASCEADEPTVEVGPYGASAQEVQPIDVGHDDDAFAGVDARLERGRNIFRYDTFGDEAFWSAQLQLNDAIAGEANGGIGAGVSPKAALELGLKVDADALPGAIARRIVAGQIDLDDPAVTLALVRLNAVVGLRGTFDLDGNMTGLGVTCALCHSTVNDSLTAGIGARLDGHPNRDLDVGKIVLAAPNLRPIQTALGGADQETIRAVLEAWGPGKYDALLLLDGKGFQPDGRSAATLIPPAYNQAGVNLATYTGFGSTPYWNSYVAVTQMHGKGRFYDPRLADADRFPLAEANGLDNIDPREDLVTSKLSDLHFYQLSLEPPRAPRGSFNPESARRGRELFEGRAACATCHAGPTFTDPGYNLHAPDEIGIDAFTASRSPTGMYRTTPLRGLHARTKGGFYHDGRFATVRDVIEHYDALLAIDLTETEKRDLESYLMSL